jgi:hypothetical protein
MKILTLGDSFTFGVELQNPDKDAWPALLAEKNNWELKNQGVGGGSNDRIIRFAFEELPNTYDLIIVGWTAWDRFEVKHGDMTAWTSANRKLLDHWHWVRDYYKYAYDDYFAFCNYLRQIIMLQSYFKQNKQRYIFCNAFDTPKAYLEQNKLEAIQLSGQVDTEYFIDWPNGHMCEWMGDCPKGPNGHPLESGHQRIAERINEYIRNLGWVS